MSTVAEKTYTPEDLLVMPDRKAYELIDGHLVERSMCRLSSWVGGRLHRFIDIFAKEHQCGWTFPAHQGCTGFPDAPGKVRRPDASFVRIDRLPGGLTSEGYIDVAPDLAVEVLSPNDNQIAEYLRVGVSLVWVINPEARTVLVHRRDGSVSRLREDEELLGEVCLPGFRCQLARIFPPKASKSRSPRDGIGDGEQTASG
jgi:Uma2 family endonuclease